VRLVIRQFTRFDNKDGEPKAQVSLLNFPNKIKIFKVTYCHKQSVIFPTSEWKRMLYAKRQLQTTNWKNYTSNCIDTANWFCGLLVFLFSSK